MQTADSLDKTLMLGKTEGKGRRGWQRMRWLDGISDSMDMNWSKVREIVKDRATWHAAVHGVAKSQTQLSHWTTAQQNVDGGDWILLNAYSQKLEEYGKLKELISKKRPELEEMESASLSGLQNTRKLVLMRQLRVWLNHHLIRELGLVWIMNLISHLQRSQE